MEAGPAFSKSSRAPRDSIDQSSERASRGDLYDTLSIDETLRTQFEKHFAEAQERVHFHAAELERWMRCARAASAALAELDLTSPPTDFDLTPVARRSSGRGE